MLYENLECTLKLFKGVAAGTEREQLWHCAILTVYVRQARRRLRQC